MQRFRSIDRESDLATPILIQACLPEGHLARYSVEIVESPDRSAIEQRYAGRGHEAYPPSLLLALLIYAYATFTPMPRGSSPVAKSSAPPTILFPFAALPVICIRIMTRWRRSASSSRKSLKRSSCRYSESPERTA